jgi:hypothetical protein
MRADDRKCEVPASLIRGEAQKAAWQPRQLIAKHPSCKGKGWFVWPYGPSPLKGCCELAQWNLWSGLSQGGPARRAN